VAERSGDRNIVNQKYQTLQLFIEQYILIEIDRFSSLLEEMEIGERRGNRRNRLDEGNLEVISSGGLKIQLSGLGRENGR